MGRHAAARINACATTIEVEDFIGCAIAERRIV
jgi:hypothetical protein